MGQPNVVAFVADLVLCCCGDVSWHQLIFCHFSERFSYVFHKSVPPILWMFFVIAVEENARIFSNFSQSLMESLVFSPKNSSFAPFYNVMFVINSCDLNIPIY